MSGLGLAVEDGKKRVVVVRSVQAGFVTFAAVFLSSRGEAVGGDDDPGDWIFGLGVVG